MAHNDETHDSQSVDTVASGKASLHRKMIISARKTSLVFRRPIIFAGIEIVFGFWESVAKVLVFGPVREQFPVILQWSVIGEFLAADRTPTPTTQQQRYNRLLYRRIHPFTRNRRTDWLIQGVRKLKSPSYTLQNVPKIPGKFRRF